MPMRTADADVWRGFLTVERDGRRLTTAVRGVMATHFIAKPKNTPLGEMFTSPPNPAEEGRGVAPLEVRDKLHWWPRIT